MDYSSDVSLIALFFPEELSAALKLKIRDHRSLSLSLSLSLYRSSPFLLFFPPTMMMLLLAITGG